MSTVDAPAATADARAQRDSRTLFQQITQSSALVVLCAVVAALLIGGLLVVVADDDVHAAAPDLFSDPGAFFSAVFSSLGAMYSAIINGAVWNFDGRDFTAQLRPITQTLTFATPLIFAGLGLGIGFRAGLFNIGAQGQLLIGAVVGGYIGFAWDLPVVLHLLVAIMGAMLGGAIWGFIPGILKAKTGAHEVITTIMLNYIALNLVAWLLVQPAFLRPGSSNPQSPRMLESSHYPQVLGSGFNLHAGFLLAIAAAFGVWWLLERSTLGFQFRAVGANAHAAKTAGMNVSLMYVLVMVTAGALAGLAGSAQVLGGPEKSITMGIAGSIGFDAITVALLGRSRPLGIVLAAILFGGLKASGPTLQVLAGVPVDIVLVVQSLIVLFIAAPPLVRFLFRLPVPAHEKEVAA